MYYAVRRMTARLCDLSTLRLCFRSRWRQNPFDEIHNPGGITNAGTAENKIGANLLRQSKMMMIMMTMTTMMATDATTATVSKAKTSPVQMLFMTVAE
mgnify:CR=1 FL=1